MRNNNHAFLITAYRDPVSLLALLKQICEIPYAKAFLAVDLNQDCNFLSHVDRIENLHPALKHSVYRLTMRWGGESHYAAMMHLMRDAIDEGYTHFHTLTGQCRLTYSASMFTKFFDSNSEKIFLEYFQLPHYGWSGEGGLARMKYFHLHNIINLKSSRALRALDRFCVSVQRVVGVNRLSVNQYFGGSGYYSVTQEAAELLIADFHKNSVRYRHSFCTEEVIPQTVLCNSSLMVRGLIQNCNLRYINWQKKHGEIPAILDEMDLEPLLAGKYLFARKFDSRFSSCLNLPLPDELGHKFLELPSGSR
jgi:hypothetical protein